MPHLVAAPDKFRGTAAASEVALAACQGAAEAGWTTDQCPMADGGEGLLEAVGGVPRFTQVTGPTGTGRVKARWSLLPSGTAVIEMAQAAGLLLAGGPDTNDPMTATTKGVGELITAAARVGAQRIVVGCGGSATTDGGWGALTALPEQRLPDGVEVLVAVDVTARFQEAAIVFGPQKGANPEQVTALTDRLRTLSATYRRRFGVDIGAIPGSGAAGGLAGGLAAVGAEIVRGFDLVAELTGLPGRVAEADVVMTGEGRLDPSSLSGKVVGGVLALAPPGVPVLCIAGDADPAVTEGVLAVASGEPGRRVRLLRLVELFGSLEAHKRVVQLVSKVVADELGALNRHP